MLGLMLTARVMAVGVSPAVQEAQFSTRADLVVLHLSVKDRKGAYVSNLTADAFSVLDNKRPQPISFFVDQDAPVTVGVLIDSSGSMAANRDLMIAAVTSFAENSNRQDEIFALSFNDDVNAVLPSDTPFTADPETLRRALLAAIVPRGRTALYDGIAAGLEYLERGTRPRRVLIVISDGGDNASRTTAQKIWQQTQGSNVLVYTVGVIDELETEANPKALKRLAEVTGGESFRPRSVHDVDMVLRRIATDIRHAYTIGYVPANTDHDGKFHTVQVAVRSPGGQRVAVRTRTGYLAGDDGRRSQP